MLFRLWVAAFVVLMLPFVVASADKPVARTMCVVTYGPDGKPLMDAKIHASIWTDDESFKVNQDYHTDAKGAAMVNLPAEVHILRLSVSHPECVALFASWEEAKTKGHGHGHGHDLPKEYVFRLPKGQTTGGRIVDEQGQPIARATVEVTYDDDDHREASDGRVRFANALATGEDAAVTGPDGRWQISRVPVSRTGKLKLMVRHSDFVSDKYPGGLQAEQAIDNGDLLAGTSVLKLQRGVRVSGRVIDPEAKPIKDALVIHGDEPDLQKRSQVRTDADGCYRLPALPSGEVRLTVVAKDWSPQTRMAKLRVGMADQNFPLVPGAPIKLKFVNVAGQPVPKVWVHIKGWENSRSLHNDLHSKVKEKLIPSFADGDGMYEWNWAPRTPVKFRCGTQGYAYQEATIAGSTAGTQTIVLQPEHRLVGAVTDAKSGQPVQQFLIIPIDVFRPNWLNAERGSSQPGQDGRFDYLAERTDIPLRIRIEARGYRTQDGPEFRVGDGSSLRQDFKLEPSPPVVGVVVGPDGKPAAGANVVLATASENADLRRDDDDNNNNNNNTATTDAAGRFEFPDPGEAFIVVAQSDAGFVMESATAGQHDAGTLRLQPWASVRGVFTEAGKPIARAGLLLEPIENDDVQLPRVNLTMYVSTDKHGRFEMTRVPPGPMLLRADLGPWEDATFRASPHVPLDLKPGETRELSLGTDGAVVRGKVQVTGDLPPDFDCNYAICYLVRREPGLPLSTQLSGKGFDITKGWQGSWDLSAEGKFYAKTLHRWFVKLARDGSFLASGVPAGDYDLVLRVYGKPTGCLIDPLAKGIVRVAVTDADVARGTLNLPDDELHAKPVPQIGVAPMIRYLRAEGTSDLAALRGQPTIVHFWASWCGPCKTQLPTVKSLHTEWSKRGVRMLSISLDEDADAWATAVKRLDLPWPQGRADLHNGENELGVSSVPCFWVLDADGKLVAKVSDPKEAANELAKLQTPR